MKTINKHHSEILFVLGICTLVLSQLIWHFWHFSDFANGSLIGVGIGLLILALLRR